MKKYVEPCAEIQKFSVDDIIATSSEVSTLSDTELPEDYFN